jgi:hypothetical protein
MSNKESDQRDYEAPPLYDIYCVRGVARRAWIHDFAIWSPIAQALQFIVDAMEEPTALRTLQTQKNTRSEWLPFGAMKWTAQSHHKWTTKYAAIKHDPTYWFAETQCCSPSWTECDKRRIFPQLEIRVSCSRPPGRQQDLVIALREGCLERLGTTRVEAAIAALAPPLLPYAACHARKMSVENSRLPGQNGAHHLDHPGETHWLPIQGVKTFGTAEQLETDRRFGPTQPDSAVIKHFCHPDGRRWSIGPTYKGYCLVIGDEDGEPMVREREASNSGVEIARLIEEVQAKGFVPLLA